jgi:hypothetical protein
LVWVLPLLGDEPVVLVLCLAIGGLEVAAAVSALHFLGAAGSSSGTSKVVSCGKCDGTGRGRRVAARG